MVVMVHMPHTVMRMHMTHTRMVHMRHTVVHMHMTHIQVQMFHTVVHMHMTHIHRMVHMPHTVVHIPSPVAWANPTDMAMASSAAAEVFSIPLSFLVVMQ